MKNETHWSTFSKPTFSVTKVTFVSFSFFGIAEGLNYVLLAQVIV